MKDVSKMSAQEILAEASKIEARKKHRREYQKQWRANNADKLKKLRVQKRKERAAILKKAQEIANKAPTSKKKKVRKKSSSKR